MVDVGTKPVTHRRATAAGRIMMQPSTLAKLSDNSMQKGDVLAVARIAGIQAAKRCDELIPLCHTLPLNDLCIDFELDEPSSAVNITATASVEGRTGVEMEAMTAVSIAALTIYDMCKAVDRGMCIEAVRLLRKEGGRSGLWERNEAASRIE